MDNVITPGVEWGGRRKRSLRQPHHGLAQAGRAAMTESEQLALILDLHRLRRQVDALRKRVAVLEDMTIKALERRDPEPP